VDEAPRIVVGLGNPGPEYADTRHNIGFRLLDRLAADLGAGPAETVGACRVARATRGDLLVVLIAPQAYMNRSGPALRTVPESTAAGPEQHLVVLDDVWLPFGALRFRPGGGPGGHKGLASVLESLESTSVPRLRLGVGGAEERDLVDYVLEPFTRDEESAMGPGLERASQAVEVFLTEGVETAMTRFNGPGGGRVPGPPET
jgi:PTH1 family peptidyl-tRNA hydrolase